MSKLSLLYRTLRHLKFSQLLYQGVFRLRRYARWQQPRADTDEPAINPNWPTVLELMPPAGAYDCLDYASGHFKFVGLEYQFGSEIDWTGATHGKLWNYNLHYFEWLWGLEPAQAKAVVLDWIDRHVYSIAAEGWEPYPLSLRIQNWIGYWSTVGAAELQRDSEFKVRLLASLDLQCDWLTQRLEKHLLGNHYLENGVALWLAGRFFSHSRAATYLSLGQAILNEQLDEQVLADGMHFERSPMYHTRVTCLLSWLSAIDASRYSRLYQRAQLTALKLQHPDGRISLFNDSSFGIYTEVAGEAPRGAFALEAAGYFGTRTGTDDYLICDAGRIGPDYIPGHAHCDIGSFELSVRGERWLTDAGIFHYESSPVRHRSRSTAMHNTFGPVGVEQAEIWSSFRVGDRPDVSVLGWQTTADDGFELALSHDGYARALKADVTYRRLVEFSGKGSMSVADHFSGPEGLPWEGRLHFAPEVRLLDANDAAITLKKGDVTMTIRLSGIADYHIVESPYWPEFNQSFQRLSIIYTVCAAQGTVTADLSW